MSILRDAVPSIEVAVLKTFWVIMGTLTVEGIGEHPDGGFFEKIVIGASSEG